MGISPRAVAQIHFRFFSRFLGGVVMFRNQNGVLGLLGVAETLDFPLDCQLVLRLEYV